MKLKNKIVVLTGASSGLGAAMAQALVNKGADVYGLARNTKKLDEIKKHLGKQFIPVEMDVCDEKKMESWITKTFSKENLPDVLINNAGIGGFKKIDEMSSQEWVNMVNTNLNGMYFITSKIVPLLKENKAVTHILNIGSILGTVGREESSAYCTTKFGVQGFSDSLFKELRNFGIKVSCINPGSIETDFFKSSGIEAHDNMLHPKELADTIIHVLETPDNMLINELTVRPLNPKQPKKL